MGRFTNRVNDTKRQRRLRQSADGSTKQTGIDKIPLDLISEQNSEVSIDEKLSQLSRKPFKGR